MKALSFDEIEEMRDNLLEEIQEVYKDIPLLRTNRPVRITDNSSMQYPVSIFANNIMKKCQSLLESKTKVITDIIHSIEELNKQINEIEKSNRIESLKNKQKERAKKKRETIKDSLSPKKSLELEQDIYRVYANFYAQISWVANRIAHDGNPNFWNTKHNNMWSAFSYALMGNLDDFNIRLDDNGDRCLDTSVEPPFQNSKKNISLHFGSEYKYYDFITQADRILSKKANERPELAYRAKLKLRYKHRQSNYARDEDIPKEDQIPTLGSNKETIQLWMIKYIDLEEKFKKLKNIDLRKKNEVSRDGIKNHILNICEKRPEIKEFILKTLEQTPTLNDDENICKHDLIDELDSILEIKSKNDMIELLTSHPDAFSIIKNRYKEDNEISSLLQNIQDVKECKNSKEREDKEKLLIYRCVGMGTEGKDAFFLDKQGEDKPSEQIGKFIKALGIDIQNLEEQIQEAFNYKEKLKEANWNIGTQTLTKNSFIDILEHGMIEHEIDFDNINEAISYYEDLDMLYGKDEDKVIESISTIIDQIINGDETSEEYNELYEYACDNNIHEFFEKLKNLLDQRPIDPPPPPPQVANNSGIPINPVLSPKVAADNGIPEAEAEFIRQARDDLSRGKDAKKIDGSPGENRE